MEKPKEEGNEPCMLKITVSYTLKVISIQFSFSCK